MLAGDIYFYVCTRSLLSSDLSLQLKSFLPFVFTPVLPSTFTKKTLWAFLTTTHYQKYQITTTSYLLSGSIYLNSRCPHIQAAKPSQNCTVNSKQAVKVSSRLLAMMMMMMILCCCWPLQRRTGVSFLKNYSTKRHSLFSGLLHIYHYNNTQEINNRYVSNTQSRNILFVQA